MKKILLLITLLFPFWAAGQTTPPAVRIAHGPYLQAVGETEFTVVWKTNIDALAWVEIAPDDGTHFYQTDRQQFCEVIDGQRPVTRLHKVRVTGLQPGTRYRYRVMQKGVLWQESNRRMVYTEGYGSDILKHDPYRVTTLDPDKPSIQFSLVNDLHEHDSVLRVLYQGITPGKYDFVLFGGDMTSYLNAEDEIFRHYMDAASELFAADTPLYVTRGNHEFRGTFSINWMDYFPTSTGHPYFAFRQGPAYFIVLDSGEDKPDEDIRNLDLIRSDDFREEQVEWLKGILKDPEFLSAPVRIVFSHIPPKINGWHGESEVARLFVPLLNEAGIDLMLCGHQHRYIFYPEGKQDNQFPIVVNPNQARMDVQVTATDIQLQIYNADGDLLHRHHFKK